MSHLIAKFTVCIALVNGSLIANAEATTHFTNASGFKLVAITNGTGSTSGVIPQIVDPNSAHEPGDDETTGEYVRPIYDTTITRLTMDCGGSTSGVQGSITWAGEWTWSCWSWTSVSAASLPSAHREYARKCDQHTPIGEPAPSCVGMMPTGPFACVPRHMH